MINTCQYCNKTYSSKGALNKHQKTAKYCIKIQNDLKPPDSPYIEFNLFNCEFCDKNLTSKIRLRTHKESCIQMYKHIIEQKENNIKQEKDNTNKIYQINQELTQKNNDLLTENRLLKEQEINHDPYNTINNLQEKLQEIALASIEQKNELISGMIKKYVKKQPRQRFDEQNVIYILTTSSLQKDRRYILGKAKNLTNRLSTYNKTDEHEVIFYQGCKEEDTMNLLEPLVFKKLKEYREQANRERFILPEDKNIDFFIDTIKNCFEFLK